MYFMYADESGDTGVNNTPTSLFIVTGIVLHDSAWQSSLDRLIAFRQRMRSRYGLRTYDEIHARHLIQRPGKLHSISSSDRYAILRNHAKEMSQMSDISIVNVAITKRPGDTRDQIFDRAWRNLIQRFSDTMRHRNFPSQKNDVGIVICDKTDPRLDRLLRKMRRYNPIPHNSWFGGSGYRNAPIRNVIEDPAHRDSRHSYFLQAADTAAYLLRQYEQPNGFFRKVGGRKQFLVLKPVLCMKVSSTDPLGIVRQ